MYMSVLYSGYRGLITSYHQSRYRLLDCYIIALKFGKQVGANHAKKSGILRSGWLDVDADLGASMARFLYHDTCLMADVLLSDKHLNCIATFMLHIHATYLK